MELSQQLFFYFLLCVVPFCLSPRCGLHCLAGSLACVYDMHAHDMGDNRGTVRYQIFQIDIQVNFHINILAPGRLLVGHSLYMHRAFQPGALGNWPPSKGASGTSPKALNFLVQYCYGEPMKGQ